MNIWREGTRAPVICRKDRGQDGWAQADKGGNWNDARANRRMIPVISPPRIPLFGASESEEVSHG